MTEREFFKRVADCDFATEVVEFAKTKYEKLESAKTAKADAQKELYDTINAKICEVLKDGAKKTSKEIFEEINDDEISQGKITWALGHFPLYQSEKGEKDRAKTYFLV